MPKVSPLYQQQSTSESQAKQPFSQLNTGGTTVNLNSQHTGAKLLSQKQIVQFEIQTNALKRKIDYELNEFHKLIETFLAVKSKRHVYSQ